MSIQSKESSEQRTQVRQKSSIQNSQQVSNKLSTLCPVQNWVTAEASGLGQQLDLSKITSATDGCINMENCLARVLILNVYILNVDYVFYLLI